MLGRTLSCARSVRGSSSFSSPTFLPTLLASHPPQGHFRRTFQSAQSFKYADEVTSPPPSTSVSTEASPSAASTPSTSSSSPTTSSLPTKLRTLKPKELKPLPPRQTKPDLIPPSSAAFATPGLEGEANLALSHLPIWTPPTPTTDPESSASGGLTLGEEKIRSPEEGEVSEVVDGGADPSSPGGASPASKTKILVRHLPFSMWEAELESAFADLGLSGKVQLATGNKPEKARRSGRHMGFGFLEFDGTDVEGLEKAVELLNGVELEGMRLQAEISDPSAPPRPLQPARTAAPKRPSPPPLPRSETAIVIKGLPNHMDESSIEDLLVDKVGASAQIHFKVFPKKGPLGDEQGTAYVEFGVPENTGRAGDFAKKALKELKGLRLATRELVVKARADMNALPPTSSPTPTPDSPSFKPSPLPRQKTLRQTSRANLDEGAGLWSSPSPSSSEGAHGFGFKKVDYRRARVGESRSERRESQQEGAKAGKGRRKREDGRYS